MKRLLVLFAVPALAAALAEDWSREVNALRPAATSGRDRPILDDIENRVKQSLGAIHHARTSREADQARPELRRRLERALGFRKMPWPPDLRPSVTGTLPRAGYRIEKIVFQALPGVEVPAHLYIPDGTQSPAPAILFYNGHWWPDSKSLPDFQAFCVNMARFGFVVLSFDPFGQGERGVSARDHRRISSLLVGVSQQGFAEYETQCALEYLLTRPEVDRNRIGMTGASGGGYNTWMTSALDDRIKVAVPVVGTSDFYLQIHFTLGNDWYHAGEHCHFVAGLLSFADNHELLAMAAPRPILIINSTTDPGFPIGEVFDYGRGLYSAYGAENKIAFFHDATAGHGYQQKKREAAYGWFQRWLMNRGDGSPVPETPVDIVPWQAPELRSFPDAKKRASGPGMVAFASKLARDTSASHPEAPEEFFGSPVPVASAPQIQDRPAQRLELTMGHGITIPAFLLRPPAVTGLLVAVDDRGKEALTDDPLVRRALVAGWAVCGIDPRGIGELATDEKGWIFSVSLLLGDNFIWRQAGDILAVATALRSTAALASKPVALYARGHNSSLAATYAIGQDARNSNSILSWYALRNGFISYRQFIERPASMRASYRLLDEDRREDRLTAFDREIPFWYVPFDVLRAFDLPQLLAASRARGLVIDPIDGDWNPMPPAGSQRLLPPAVRTITEENLSAVDDLLRSSKP